MLQGCSVKRNLLTTFPAQRCSPGICWPQFRPFCRTWACAHPATNVGQKKAEAVPTSPLETSGAWMKNGSPASPMAQAFCWQIPPKVSKLLISSTFCSTKPGWKRQSHSIPDSRYPNHSIPTEKDSLRNYPTRQVFRLLSAKNWSHRSSKDSDSSDTGSNSCSTSCSRKPGASSGNGPAIPKFGFLIITQLTLRFYSNLLEYLLKSINNFTQI